MKKIPFEPGVLKSTAQDFDEPSLWVEDGLIHFCYFISRSIPNEFKPIDKNAERKFSYAEGIKALQLSRSFFGTNLKFEPKEHVSTLRDWFYEAITQFLNENFQVIKKDWHEGSDRQTDRAFRKHKRTAITRVIEKLKAELNEL